MISLSSYNIFEIIFGVFFVWIGVYNLSRNVASTLSWLTFGLLACIGIVIATDPLYVNTATLQEYIFWQKVFDLPLYLLPVICYHISIFVISRKRLHNNIMIMGYIIVAIAYGIDLFTDLIVTRKIIRLSDFKYNYALAPGPLLTPLIIVLILYMVSAVYNFVVAKKEKNETKYNLTILGIVVFVLTTLFVLFCYYIEVPFATVYLTAGMVLGTGLIAYSIIRYHLFLPGEKIIFDKNFFYQTVLIAIILVVYMLGFAISKVPLTFPVFLFLNITVLLILVTHSFYGWFTTFANDLSYNPKSGFSVVKDDEVGEAIRNYNFAEKNENSPLLKLKIVLSRVKGKVTPIDALKSVIEESIEYFMPKHDMTRRTKRNLKYHLLKMLAYDEAEEGQILWELGYEEYPVKILSQERRYREPLFKIQAASDYIYTSRNAYLALKKEAIHDITWRISYLEKQARKRMF